MRPLRLRAITAAALVVVSALAAPRLIAQDSAVAAPKKPVKGRANLITEDEIATAATGLQNAFFVVQRLRPQMLRVRSGSTSSGGSSSSMDVTSSELFVYLDSQRMGGVDALREIQTTSVREIRHLSPSDATTLFGTG
ncbi:MAG TPA: hypothetical protein VE861_00195, partial [Gemmatimonadaceae bacterium]|nr:hypothetical protein [Gemmatimonadaceae bacterium]